MKFQLGNIKKLVSVSIHFVGTEMRISGVVVRYKKGEIEIVDEVNGLSGIKNLIDKLGSKNPYIIHFSGKGVLNKKVDNGENMHQSVLLNANSNDFYFTDYIDEGKAFSSVIRKNVTDEVLNELNEAKVNVISITSGPFVVMAIAPFLNLKSFNTTDYNLTIADNHINTFGKKEEGARTSYQIGEKRVSENAIAAVAHAVLFFNGNTAFTLPENQMVFGKNKEEAKQKVIFSQFGFFMMVFFLTVLLGNYLYLGHLNNVYQSNSLMLADYVEDFNEISKLEEEKTRKEILLRTSGVLSKKYISFYLAEISGTVPKEIAFTQFTVKPLKKDIKSKHKIEIDNQLIYISGISKTSSYLSDWILELKAIEWIRKVDITDYNYLDGQGEFSIKIVI